MIAGIAVLIVVGVLFGVLGLAIKGIAWLAIIGIVFVVSAIGIALWQALRDTRPRA
jgi:hypothetical protein